MAKITASQALKEARTVARPDQQIIKSLEFKREDWSNPIRITDYGGGGLDNVVDLPLGSGVTEQFTCTAFKVAEPIQGEVKTNKIKLQINNVNGLISNSLMTVEGYGWIIEVIYRVHLVTNGNISEPQLVPAPKYEVESVSGFAVLNVVLSPRDYTRKKFPIYNIGKMSN